MSFAREIVEIMAVSQLRSTLKRTDAAVVQVTRIRSPDIVVNATGQFTDVRTDSPALQAASHRSAIQHSFDQTRAQIAERTQRTIKVTFCSQ